MQEHDVEVGELGAPEPLVLSRGCARLQQLGLLDERADDERLPAGTQLFADTLVCTRAGALTVGLSEAA
jgi:hypothetical protein